MELDLNAIGLYDVEDVARAVVDSLQSQQVDIDMVPGLFGVFGHQLQFALSVVNDDLIHLLLHSSPQFLLTTCGWRYLQINCQGVEVPPDCHFRLDIGP